MVHWRFLREMTTRGVLGAKKLATFEDPSPPNVEPLERSQLGQGLEYREKISEAAWMGPLSRVPAQNLSDCKSIWATSTKWSLFLASLLLSFSPAISCAWCLFNWFLNMMFLVISLSSLPPSPFFLSSIGWEEIVLLYVRLLLTPYYTFLSNPFC